MYGEQESRAGNDEVEGRWNRIVHEIKTIESRNEELILCGDFNKHLGDIIPGNHQKCSFGGKLVKTFLKSDKYVLVNATEKAEGGPFTRYDPSDPKNDNLKSCLDLAIVSKNLFRYVEKLIIDKRLALTPGRAISKSKLVYSDHYALILKFKDIPLRQEQNLAGPRYITWNTNKEGGWDVYKEITDEDSKLAAIGRDVIDDATEAMKKINKELDKCKFQAFGKVSVRQSPIVNKDIDSLFKKKSKMLEKEDSTERDCEVKKLENEIASRLVGKQ